MLAQRPKWVTHLTVYIHYKIYSYSLCSALSIVNLRIVLNDMSTPLIYRAPLRVTGIFFCICNRILNDTSEGNYEGYSLHRCLSK